MYHYILDLRRTSYQEDQGGITSSFRQLEVHPILMHGPSKQGMG